jgi:NTP pyrophosphatase (non-canonical NTP hydrolase)
MYRRVTVKDKLEQIQAEQKEWSNANFGPQSPTLPLLGVVEEVGELCHAVLKREQGIRRDENHLENEVDAIGDICIYLMDYCNRRGFNLMEIIDETWNEVQGRHRGSGGGLTVRDDGTSVYPDPAAKLRCAYDDDDFSVDLDSANDGRSSGVLRAGDSVSGRVVYDHESPFFEDETQADSPIFDEGAGESERSE